MAISTIDSTGLAAGGVAAANLASGVPSTAQLPTGTVLQVVSATYSTATATTSTTYVDTGLSATITPTKSTSKIFVIFTMPVRSGVNNYTAFRMYRSLGGATYSLYAGWGYNDYGSDRTGQLAGSWLDTPASTASINYKVQMASTGGGVTTIAQVDNCSSTMTLMEIAA